MNRLYIALLLCFTILSSCGTTPTRELTIRNPAVSGRFYPSDPEDLAHSIDTFLENAIEPVVDSPVAIVVPHAGYVYSGQICADGFRQAMGNDYDLIVVLGTNHTTQGFLKISVNDCDGYRTPLGVASVDTSLVKELLQHDELVEYNPAVHRSEHSVEVQIPFIQRIFPSTPILPVVVGMPEPEMCTAFGHLLAELVGERKVLIVASSDLSHYPSYEDANRVDRATLESILQMDPHQFFDATQDQLRSSIPNLSTCACGAGPIMVAMTAASALNASHPTILSYANSADIPVGSQDRAVGYGAVAFSAQVASAFPAPFPPRENANLPSPLNDSLRRSLLNHARQTITRYLATETFPLTRSLDPCLRANRGGFVTLTKHGELRGCIGHMAQDMPLCNVIGAMAFQASQNDRRFYPVTLDEMDDIEIEISLLTPYERVSGPDDIVIGRDGVLIRKNGRSAVYLPHVAPEQGWDITETLQHLCRKAGLPSNAWRDNMEFFTFQAEVFSENDYH